MAKGKLSSRSSTVPQLWSLKYYAYPQSNLIVRHLKPEGRLFFSPLFVVKKKRPWLLLCVCRAHLEIVLSWNKCTWRKHRLTNCSRTHRAAALLSVSVSYSGTRGSVLSKAAAVGQCDSDATTRSRWQRLILTVNSGLQQHGPSVKPTKGWV